MNDETNTLSGGWVFADEGKSDKVIDSGNIHVPCNVIAYGYDDQYIIAEQRPTSNCFLGSDTFKYKYGFDSTYYWIIGHERKIFIGPLTTEEFNKMKEQIGIPKDLSLKPVY
jgi:hypothetical protein